MAVGVVVPAVTVAVVTEPAAANRLVTPRMVTTRSPCPHGMYGEVALPGPVGRDERWESTGDDGTRAEVGAEPDLGQPSLDDPSERLVFSKVHVHHSGTVPITARLAPDAGVLDTAGENNRGDYMRSDMVHMSADPPQFEPGGEVDPTVGFPFPGTPNRPGCTSRFPGEAARPVWSGTSREARNPRLRTGVLPCRVEGVVRFEIRLVDV